MSQLDLLILIVYAITTFYVLSRAVESLDARIKIDFNQAKFDATLEKYDLAGKIAVKIPVNKRYGLNDYPNALAVTIKNKSEDTLYIDWDRSSITNIGGQASRVIRLTPYKSPDLSHPQVFSVVPPGQSIAETVTAEDALTPDPETGALVPSRSLFQIPGKALAGLDDRVSYALWLVCQISEQNSASRGDRLYILPCEFVARKMPWTDSLPWAG